MIKINLIMKTLFKYAAPLIVSCLLFIVGDICADGAWVNKLNNPRYVFHHKIGLEKPKAKLLFVKIKNANNIKTNSHITDGLQLQLMNAEYKELANAIVKNGVAQFDLSNIKNKDNFYTLISPQTSDEYTFNNESSCEEMQIDVTELIIKQKGKK